MNKAGILFAIGISKYTTREAVRNIYAFWGGPRGRGCIRSGLMSIRFWLLYISVLGESAPEPGMLLQGSTSIYNGGGETGGASEAHVHQGFSEHLEPNNLPTPGLTWGRQSAPEPALVTLLGG